MHWPSGEPDSQEPPTIDDESWAIAADTPPVAQWVFVALPPVEYACMRKNLTKSQPLVKSGMADELKRKYYQDNREERLAYQREYYRKNKLKIKEAKEARKEKDPEWEAKQREYNRNYYLKNKERIMLKRAKRAVSS